MKRQNLPKTAIEPGMDARAGEIRMPARSTGHDMRNAREVIA